MKEYKKIESRDGRTYYLNEDDTVQFIIGYKGGRYKYKYLRRLENEGKISWN